MGSSELPVDQLGWAQEVEQGIGQSFLLLQQQSMTWINGSSLRVGSEMQQEVMESGHQHCPVPKLELVLEEKAVIA